MQADAPCKASLDRLASRIALYDQKYDQHDKVQKEI
jgi:hypothetical protein